MKQAAHLGVDLFHELLPQLQPGMPETTVAALLEHSARQRGAPRACPSRRSSPAAPFGLAAWPRHRPAVAA
jgi:Xaa-Pro aminopeptidase